MSTLELTRLAELYRRHAGDFLHEGTREENEDLLVALQRAVPGLERAPYQAAVYRVKSLRHLSHPDSHKLLEQEGFGRA